MDQETLKQLAQALDANLEAYKRENHYWFTSSLIRIIKEALTSLRHYIENPEDLEITWQNPKAELQFPIRWDVKSRRIIYFDTSSDTIRNAQKAAEALLSALTISCLETLHQAAYEKHGDTYHHFLKQAQDSFYKTLPEDKQESFLKNCLAPYFIGPQIWDTSNLADLIIPHRVEPLENRLLDLRNFLQSTKAEENVISFHYNQNGKDLNLGFQIAIHPLIVDVSEKKAFFPIHAHLVTSSSDNPSEWNESERKELWDFLLGTFEEQETRWFEGFQTNLEIGAILAPLIKTSTQASTIAPPKARRLHKMDPVPIPRSAMKEAESASLLRGLGRMFSGYSNVPDLDLRGDIAQAEAEKLFWILLKEQISAYLTTQSFSHASWEQTEIAGKTIFRFRGLQEADVKSLWGRVTKAANAGEGGPGLEIADPEFINKNRLEENQSVVETELVLWPEESLHNKEGYPIPRVHFRRSSSPGYQSLINNYLTEHKGKPFFSDGWLWLPRGNIKEGVRIGGLPTLLFPEGRAALESIQRRQIQNYEDELHRIFTAQELSLADSQLPLFQGDEKKTIRDLQDAIARVKFRIARLSVYDIGTDLILCIFEAFYHQRNAWYAEKLKFPDGREVVTKPWRVLFLDPGQLHLRLDPSKKWGQNWRNRLLEKLEALSTFERQTRTLDDKKIDVGDRLIRRVIDGWAGIEDGHAPEWDSGLGLTRILKQANLLPMNGFFIEVSAEFMARLITWAVDPKGIVHWGLDAAKAAQRTVLALPDSNRKEALIKKKEVMGRVKQQPYYQHSPRLLTFSNLKEWPTTRKMLAYVLLQEANSHLSDGVFTPCNGKYGYGYKVKVWMQKAGYLQPQQVRRTSHRHQLKMFFDDLHELQQSLELKLELKEEPSLDTKSVLEKLVSLPKKKTVAYALLLKIYLPSNYEEQLEDKLQKAGIEEEVEQIQKETEALPTTEFALPELASARKKAKLTQAALAQKLGVSQAMVAYWENRKRPIPLEHQAQLKVLLGAYLDR